jgi:hypothetical protein
MKTVSAARKTIRRPLQKEASASVMTRDSGTVGRLTFHYKIREELPATRALAPLCCCLL